MGITDEVKFKCNYTTIIINYYYYLGINGMDKITETARYKNNNLIKLSTFPFSLLNFTKNKQC